MKKYPVIIGRFEHIDIVDKLQAIPAKVDTGAYRSAIHTSDIGIIQKNGVQYLHFTILGHPSFKQKQTLQSRAFREVVVTSSTGHQTTRFEVSLKIRLGYKIFQTSFTLADRTHTTFPILIGRKVIRDRFLVDVGRSSLSRKELKQAATELIKQGDQEYLEELEQWKSQFYQTDREIIQLPD